MFKSCNFSYEGNESPDKITDSGYGGNVSTKTDEEVKRGWQDRYILACGEKTVHLCHSGEEADAERA